MPAELGNLTNLTHLVLYGNQLNGPVPAALGNLINLDTLWLSFNYNLTGPLPESLLQTGAARIDVSATNTCVANAQAWEARIETFWPSGLVCGDDTIVDIDVAVFYTPAALAAACVTESSCSRGDQQDAIDARIVQNFLYANTALEKSGVHLRLSVRHTEELNYAETNMSTDLDRLHSPGDGHLDEVHGKRNLYGADLVHLIVGGELVAFTEGLRICGIAKRVVDVDESHAFSIGHVDPILQSYFRARIESQHGTRPRSP